MRDSNRAERRSAAPTKCWNRRFRLSFGFTLLLTVVACGGHEFQIVQAQWPGTESTQARLQAGAEAVGCNVTREADEQVISCRDGVLGEEIDAGTIRIGPSAEGESMIAMCEGGLSAACSSVLKRIWEAGK